MPRKILIRTDTGCYHVMSRVNHKRNFPIPLSQCWPIFLRKLSKVKELYCPQIHAFVLMSNHYHLLLSTPLLNIDLVMKYINREVTRDISSKTGLINHIFGARYRWNVVYAPNDVAHVLKYIIRNPVKAEITNTVEEYSFSTVKSLLGVHDFNFLEDLSLLPSSFPHGNPEAVLKWLNRPLPKEEQALLTKAMKRKEFKYSLHHRYKKIITNLNDVSW